MPAALRWTETVPQNLWLHCTKLRNVPEEDKESAADEATEAAAAAATAEAAEVAPAACCCELAQTSQQS